jgi:nickel-dependent lactate racemase
MPEFDIPWGAWYRDEPLTLTFPDGWHVESADMASSPEATAQDLRRAFENPIGSPRVSELAQGRRTAVIAVDDMTRPTRAARILPILLEELARGGIEESRVTIVMALGSHRAMTRQDLVKKLGEDVLRRVRVYNHCPFDNLVYVGDSSAGTPIHVNRRFMEADLKIAVGFIVPHPAAGWGGGGKIVVPGVCGIETLAAFHGPRVGNTTCEIARLEGNELREDIEDIARRVGLDVVANAVGTSTGATAALFVGHPHQAHRAGVAAAERLYATRVPRDIDVGFFNAYPEDSEFIQSVKALNVWSDPNRDIVKPGGTIVLATAASEGRGTHYLTDVGMRLEGRPTNNPSFRRKLEGRTLMVFSPGASPHDCTDRFPPETFFSADWKAVLVALSARHGAGTHAVVFPCCSLQVLAD